MTGNGVVAIEYSQGWFMTILDVAFECPAPKVGHLKSP